MTKFFLITMAMLWLSAASATALAQSGQSPAVPAHPLAEMAVQPVMPELVDSEQAECRLAGGFPSQARQLDGSYSQLCAMPNGKRCYLSALQAGNCG